MFQKLLLDFGSIERKSLSRPPDFVRPETDVEHSYDLAMMAWFLADFFPKLDRDKLIRYALAHDLVEIHAGDTYAYGSENELADKVEREKAALKQLKQEWPDFPDLINAIREYEKRDSEESKFVYALDKLMPTLIGYIAEGNDWHEQNITFEMFVAEKEKKIPVSPDIYSYYQEILDLLKQNLHFFPSTEGKAE